MAAQQAPRPTFTSAVDLVPVDVSVVDKNGKPVADLKADDFSIMVDGRPRKVVSAEFFSVPQTVPESAPAPAYFSSNAGVAGGRLIVMVVDSANISTARAKSTLDAASRFVARLNPADRVALVTLPNGGAQIDFTSNHGLVQAALPKIIGQSSASVASRALGVGGALAFERNDDSVIAQVVERQCSGDASPTNPLGREACIQQLVNEANALLADARARAQQSITALQHLFDRLATTDTPKTIVLISEGMLLSREFSEVTWMGPRATSARITLHVLQIDTMDPNGGDRNSPTRNEDREVLRDGLEAMAGMARGDVLRIASSPDLAFQRLALEMSGYYLLGFEPQAGDRDAKPHKIRVDVLRRDVELRARREFSVAPTAAPTPETRLLDTLRSPLLVPDIGLKLTTYAFKDPDSARVRVILATDVDRSANVDGQYALAYILTDDKGKVVANQIEKAVSTPVRPDTKSQTYVGAALVAPGSYTLKLAVVDDGGRRGSVERSVNAKVNSIESLQVSDMLIADNSAPAAGGGVTPAVDANFVGDEVHGYLEVFSDTPEALRGASATIEVAENASAKTLAGVPASLESNGRRTVVQGIVPVGLLPAGDYVLRAAIVVNGRQAGQIVRPFHIARDAKASTVSSGASGVNTAPVPIAKPSTVTSRIGAFDRSTVLAPQIVGFFLDRLAAAAPSPTVRPAMADARAGRFDEVMNAVDKAGDDDLAAVFLKGLVLLSRGELNPAANKFRDALRIDSEFLPAAFYLGACYAAGGKDREAASAWQMSLVGDADAPFVYTLLGDALLRMRSIDQAIEILTEARGRWPDDDEVAARLGTALAMGSKGADAMPLLDTYLQKHPDDQERLFLALRTLYEARSRGRSIGSPDEDRAKFVRYADAYAAAKGPQLAIVEQWRKQMDRK